jgi:hypothetical protein
MYRFFEYCFYRICFVYHKRKIDIHPQIYSSGWVTGAQLFNILTIVDIYQIFTNTKYNATILVWSIVISLGIINSFILLTEKKYIKLTEKYKEEKNKKIKGWGVFLYVSVSILIYPCIRIIFC